MIPPITVLMTVYNSEKFLAESIESVLDQTFRNFEFLIINDGSTDKSLQILQKYAVKDDRIRLINNAVNKGIIDSLNEGLQSSLGEYIAKMDADDISLPERFEKQYAFLTTHPSYVCVGCKTMLIDPEGNELKIFPFYGGNEAIVKAMLKGVGGAIIHPSAMIRKSAIEKVGGYNTAFKYAEDAELFLQLSEIGLVANLPEVLLKYRQNPKGIGYSNRKTQREAYLISMENAHKRRKIPFSKKDFESDIEDAEELPYRTWGWWALSSGNVKVARKYAFKTILRSPFSKESWKLLYCSLRGN